MEKSNSKREGVYNTLFWVAQSVLAFMFFVAGSTKASQPMQELGSIIPWTGDVPIALVRFIGVSEMLAALGLVFPSLLRVKPLVTPLAASCLICIMIMAFVFHLIRAEYDALLINSILGILSGFVAWGRYVKAPIQDRRTTVISVLSQG